MNARDRIAAWFVRNDPTTACEWTEADEYDLATKYARLLFENGALRARVAEVEAENAKLDQQNMALLDTLTEHRLTTDPTARVPRLRVVPSPSKPIHLVPLSDQEWDDLQRETRWES